MIHLDQEADPAFAQSFDLRDRGLLLADGVFDTAMVIGGRVVFAEAHRARLLGDAEALGIEVDPARIEAAAAGARADADFGALRVTVTRGPGARGLAPAGVGRATVLASFSAGDPGRVFAPARFAPTSIRRNETSLTSRHKTLAYLDSVLAAREAAAAGADESLLLNTRGRLACGAAGNVFLLKGEALSTPAVVEGVLPGVIRGWVLKNAHRVGLEAREAAIAPEEAAAADAAFLTSSLRLIAPAAGITTHDGGRPAVVTHLMRLLVDDLRADGFDPPFAAPGEV